MSNRKLSFVLVLIAFSLLGCSDKKLPIRVGTNLWLGYEPLYLAQNLGYLTASDARLVEYSSASQVIRAYRNGAIDAAALTLDEVLTLLENNFHPKIFLIADFSSGADVIIGQPDVQQLSELKGKRIGVEDTALGGYFLSRALEESGLTPSDVTVVTMEMDEHERAFVDHQVDAVVTFEPVKTKLLNRSGRILFDSSKIPKEIVDVLVVDESYYASNKVVIDKLSDAWFKALAYVRQQPNEAAAFMASRQQLSSAEFKAAYQGIYFPNPAENRQMLSTKDPRSLLSTTKRLTEIMLDKKLLKRPINPEKLFFSVDSGASN